jgi:hypothetical protein
MVGEALKWTCMVAWCPVTMMESFSVMRVMRRYVLEEESVQISI